MIKLTAHATPVIKHIVVSTGDGDPNQPKLTLAVEHERLVSEVRRAVNAWLYEQEAT